MPDKPADEFIIPNKFIEQLKEFSNGGFILLTFSSNGNPVIHHYYETKKDQLALESSMDTYAEKLNREKYAEEEEDEKKDDEEEG